MIHRKKNIVKPILLSIGFLIMAGLCIAAMLCIKKYGLDNVIEYIKSYVASLGAFGILFTFLIQTLQVILAFIPGEPIEIAAGALYGTVGGTLLCLAGIGTGSLIIFLLVKILGKKLVLKVIGSDKYSRLKFLKDPAKRDIFIFLLMFIPGTPKDVLTYFAPLSGISMVRFIIIASIARIPSVISSTYVGGSIAKGQYIYSLAVFLIVGAVSIGGIILYNKIIEAKNKEKNGHKNG